MTDKIVQIGGGQHFSVVSIFISGPKCIEFKSRLQSVFEKTLIFAELIDSSALLRVRVGSENN